MPGWEYPTRGYLGISSAYVGGASITCSPVAAEPAGCPDGDAEQFGIGGPLEPHDAGIGRFDLQLPGVADIEDRDRQEGRSRGTVHLGQRPGRGPIRMDW